MVSCRGAGLTHDTRDLAADPDDIEAAISVPSSQKAFMSLAVSTPNNSQSSALHPAEAHLPLLRHCKGQVLASNGCGRSLGSALDATFKLVAPLAACEDSSVPGCGAAAARKLLAQLPVGDGSMVSKQPGLVSIEAVSQPGRYLTADMQSGELLLREPRDPGATHLVQSFALQPQPSAAGSAAMFSLVPQGQPSWIVGLAADDQRLVVQVSVFSGATEMPGR
jgi:hypothetical protein